MAFEDFLNHKCSIYHLVTQTTSPGFGLPGQTTYSYPDKPDLEHIPCHFNVDANAAVIQQNPMNTYLYLGKLQLPAGTDVRVHDKIVNEETGVAFTAQFPQDIRGHHIVVTIQRKNDIEVAL